MGRALKIIAWVVAAAIAVFVLAAVALYLFFDPNDFREDISAAVKERTGRDLVIDGDVSLTLFPWLAVDVGKTTLGDTQGFGDAPMAAFDSASFSVRLLPLLLRQEIVVGAVDLEVLHLNLKVDKTGRTNWSDLAPEDEAGTDSGDGGGSDVDINRISISGSTITYSNAESDERIVMDDLDLSVGRLKSDGSPVPLEGNMNFDVQPASLSGSVTFNSVVSYDSDASQLTVSDMNVDGSVEGIAAIPSRLSVNADSIEVDTEASQVTMPRVEMSLLEMDIVADVEPFTYDGRITPKARVAIDAFSPRTMMQMFDVEPPVTADPSALASVIIDGTAQLMTDAIEMTDVTIKLDDTTFKGTLSVPRADDPYRFELTGDAIDATRYMEPADEGGTAASAGDTIPVEIPAELIKPLNARGKLTLQQATLGGMVFENIEVGMNSNAGKLRLYPISSQLFGGTYNGDVRIDASGSVPVLSLNENVANVDLADLAKAMYDQDNITGTISGSFKLTGRGADLAAVQRSLAGNMSFELKDGTFEGTDIWYELRRARALLKKEEPPEATLPPRTEFSSVTATGVVTDGVMRNNDLFAEIPHMQLTGSGSVDLPSATVDYGLTARVLEKPEFVKDATPEELDEFTEAVIPLKITGPLASPNVRPDIEKLIRNRVEDEIKDRLKDKLGDLFN